jgi:hypothetical protein
MARYVYLVTVDAVEGQDEEFNRWLDEHHIPEVLRTQGFVSVRRFELPPAEAANPSARRYMHFYEIETDDIEATKAALAAGRDSRTPTTPAMNLSSVSAVFYRAR